MSFFIILFTFIFLSLQAIAADKPAVKKNSVEDIFIWKVSDELKLSASEEKKFADIHRDLNRKKFDLSVQLQKLSKNSDAAVSKAKASEVIKNYKKTLIEYNNLSVQELDKVKELLGDQRFLEYLAIKQDINQKLKSLVLGEETKLKPSKLPPPQIIEEK
jgi:hypothetical protein